MTSACWLIVLMMHAKQVQFAVNRDWCSYVKHRAYSSQGTSSNADICGLLHPSGWLLLAVSPEVYCCLGLQGVKRTVQGLAKTPTSLPGQKQNTADAGSLRPQSPGVSSASKSKQRPPVGRSPNSQGKAKSSVKKAENSGAQIKKAELSVRYLVPVKLRGLGVRPKQLVRAQRAFAQIATPVACRISALQGGEAVVCGLPGVDWHV